MHRTPANDILCSIYRLRRVESFIMTLDRRVFRVVSRLGNRPFHAKSNSLGEKGLIFKFKFRPISKSSLRIAYLIPCTNLSFFGSFFVLSLYLCIAHDNEQNASCISVADRPIEIQSQSGTLNVRVKNVRDVLEESVGK